MKNSFHFGDGKKHKSCFTEAGGFDVYVLVSCSLIEKPIHKL